MTSEAGILFRKKTATPGGILHLSSLINANQVVTVKEGYYNGPKSLRPKDHYGAGRGYSGVALSRVGRNRPGRASSPDPERGHAPGPEVQSGPGGRVGLAGVETAEADLARARVRFLPTVNFNETYNFSDSPSQVFMSKLNQLVSPARIFSSTT